MTPWHQLPPCLSLLPSEADVVDVVVVVAEVDLDSQLEPVSHEFLPHLPREAADAVVVLVAQPEPVSH